MSYYVSCKEMLVDCCYIYSHVEYDDHHNAAIATTKKQKRNKQKQKKTKKKQKQKQVNTIEFGM